MKKSYLKLRRRIEDEGLEQKQLAVLAGIGNRTLNRRLNVPESQGEWNSKEIVAICRVGGISQEEIGEYFFPCLKKEDKPA